MTKNLRPSRSGPNYSILAAQQRAILHLDLDAFFAAVEIRDNDHFRRRPLLIGGRSGRGVVASCSYEARRFGVHAGMPMKVALRRCPEATVLSGDMDKYSRASQLVTEVIADSAPLYEKASIDEFYLDLTGMDRFIGTWQWSKELKQRIIKASGLPISIGLALNKLVAKVGTNLRKPNATMRVPVGRERKFLSPLSIRKLPGVGEQTNRKLSFMGIKRVGILAEIPPDLLVREFGKTGKSLWEKANGIDRRKVVPARKAKSMSKERTFQTDTIDVDFLRRTLSQLTTLLAFELRNAKKLTSVVTVKIRYTDFNTYTKQCRISYTATDRRLINTVLQLFTGLYNRRQLIRLVGVKFSGLVKGSVQVNLFEDTGKEIDLLVAMDRIRQRFGAKAVGWGGQ